MDEQENMQMNDAMPEETQTDASDVCMNCGSRSCDGSCGDTTSTSAMMDADTKSCVCGTEGCACKKSRKKMILKVVGLIIIIYLITLIV